MFAKPDNWNELGPDEKIRARLDHWEDPSGIVFESPEAEAKYKERIKLFRDAYEMKGSSRVPCIPGIGGYVLRRAGISEYDALYIKKVMFSRL